MPAVLPIMIVVGAVINLCFSQKKQRRRVILVSAVLGGMMVLTAIGFFVGSRIKDKLSEEYRIEAGGLLGSLTYDETHDGYHYFTSTTLGSSDTIRVSEEEASVPAISKMVGDVIICRDRDTKQVGSDGGRVVKIVADLQMMSFAAGVILLVAMAVYESVELILLVILKIVNRKR